MVRERLRASGEAVEGEKKRIRRGSDEVDILVDWRWVVEVLFWWLWWDCCEVGSDGLLEDECVWWRDVDVRGAFCKRMPSRKERNRKCRVNREDMGFL